MFVTRDLGLDVPSLAAALGFGTSNLPAPSASYRVAADENPPHAAWAAVDWQSDARDTVAALSSDAPDWLVVDHYSFDARWHSRVAEQLGSRIAVIDDLADRSCFAEVLVDHNLDAVGGSKYAGCALSRTRMLCGPRFALLGAAYRNPQRYAFHDSVRSIGIFMGGVDARGLNVIALRACRAVAGFAGLVEVVVSSSSPNAAELQSLAASLPPTRVSRDLPDLSAFFARHDLQIGAGGGAALERAAVGVPSLLLIAAENQRRVVSSLTALGAAASLEPNVPLSQERVAGAVTALIGDAATRRRLAERSGRLVDGRGTTRVALCLLASELKIRRAHSGDTAMMFEWRNHPSTRAVSRDPASLGLESHARWVERALADNNRCLLIGYVGDLNVGVIRFDVLDEDSMEVSLYLDPELHGLGLGKALLLAGEAHVASTSKGSVRLVAFTLDGNMPSKRLFEACTYRFAEGRWEKTLTARQARQG